MMVGAQADSDIALGEDDPFLWSMQQMMRGVEMGQVLELNKKLSREYLARATEILDEKEYSLFEQSLKQYDERTGLTLRMSTR